MDESLVDEVRDRIRRLVEAGQLEEAALALTALHPADRAEAFATSDEDTRNALLPLLGTEATAELLAELPSHLAAETSEPMQTDELSTVLDRMDPDEAADLLGDLPPVRAALVLGEMDRAEDVLPLLHHEDESAGGLMTTAFVAVRRQMTAAEAIDFLRHISPETETPYYLYVIDRNGKLIGNIGLRDLIVAAPSSPVETFMDRDVVSVLAGTDQEEVARMFVRYDLAALPVVDPVGVLLGVITYDDIIDVLEEEATEDVLNMGGIEAGSISDRPYWSLSIGQVVRSRFVWLLALFVAETLTGTVLRHFETTLQAVVSLSFFIPLLIGTGGNAGSQTVASIIRALALDEVEPRDLISVVLRELGVGALLGVLLGAVAYGRVLFWGLDPSMALVVAVTILCICVWANTVGSLIPIAADVVGIDPAVISAPMITTLVDATGLLIYFTVAVLVLHPVA
jgi:magnesium transporter